MKNSQKIKAILVGLAASDKLPQDMTQLDSELFAQFDTIHNVGGFTSVDVEGIASLMEIKLTQEETKKVLALMEKKFDATVGMSWDVIEEAVAEIIEATHEQETEQSIIDFDNNHEGK